MNATSEPTVGLASARAIIDFFLQFNMDSQALARELNIDENLLTEADQRLPLSIYHAIWDLAIKMLIEDADGLDMVGPISAYVAEIINYQ